MNENLKNKIDKKFSAIASIQEWHNNDFFLDTYEKFITKFGNGVIDPKEKNDFSQEYQYAREQLDAIYKELNKKHLDSIQEEETAIYEEGYKIYTFKDLMQQAHKEPGRKPIKTGFEQLDKALGGGLYEGLYTLNAITGIGKTTFLLNMAKNISRQGKKVLFFSLEMSNEYIRNTLLAMIVKEINESKKGKKAKIESIARSNIKSQLEELERYTEIEEYKLNENLLIVSVKQCSIEQVIRATKQYLNDNPQEEKPVIMIDYLQKLNTEEHVKDDRTRVDKCLEKIVDLSKNYGLTVIQVSSVSRSNYLDNMSIGSGKESGSIEYESTVVLGLDYGIDAKGNIQDAKVKLQNASSQLIKDIYLRINKNRYGSPVEQIHYRFYGQYGYFVEVKE